MHTDNINNIFSTKHFELFYMIKHLSNLSMPECLVGMLESWYVWNQLKITYRYCISTVFTSCLRFPFKTWDARPRHSFPPPLRAPVSLTHCIPCALTCFWSIKRSLSAPSMSTVSPDKRRKMESALNQLKKHTVVVADTGDFNGNTLRLSLLAC